MTAESVATLKASALGEKIKWIADLDAALRYAAEFQQLTTQFRRSSNWVAFQRYCEESGLRLNNRAVRILRRLVSLTATTS